jgi:hypothetical protein
MPYDRGDSREGTPCAREIAGIDMAVNGCDASLGVEGVGEILHKPELARASRLWDDANGGRLKWADKGLDSLFREGAHISPFIQFQLYDVVECAAVL